MFSCVSLHLAAPMMASRCHERWASAHLLLHSWITPIEATKGGQQQRREPNHYVIPPIQPLVRGFSQLLVCPRPSTVSCVCLVRASSPAHTPEQPSSPRRVHLDPHPQQQRPAEERTQLPDEWYTISITLSSFSAWRMDENLDVWCLAACQAWQQTRRLQLSEDATARSQILHLYPRFGTCNATNVFAYL